jgi:hypothetical protein
MTEFTLVGSLRNCIKYVTVIVMTVTPVVCMVRCSVIIQCYKFLLVTSLLTPWHTQLAVRRPGSLGRLIHSRL